MSNNNNEMTFESAISRIEEIVALLEGNQVTLNDSIKLFEEGTRLTSFCLEQLDNAKQKITELNKEQL